MSVIENYIAPTSLREATEVLHRGETTVLAGGTDLKPQTESGKRQFAPTLMNIRRIDELNGITKRDQRIRIGALTTVTDVLESSLVRKHAPVLAEAADCFASSQLRNASTIGGNLCNASPAGDMIIPLLLLDAEAELACWSDADRAVATRSVPLAEFFTGPGGTKKRIDELLTAAEFGAPKDGFGARFIKSGPRPALEISTVSLGIAGILTDGALHEVRVALGAVAPTPLRARQCEAVLEGRQLDAALIAEAAEAAVSEASPIDDVRASAWYRKHLIRIFTRRALTDVIGSRA